MCFDVPVMFPGQAIYLGFTGQKIKFKWPKATQAPILILTVENDSSE